MLSLEKLRAYIALTRLNKPIGIYLLLWPTLWALWLAARGIPTLRLFFIFVAGVVVMRSAGCVLNDLADRQFDGHVARTRHRPIVAGKVSVKEAYGILVFLLSLALGLLLMLPWQVVPFALISLALAYFYPRVKRFFHGPQFVLGVAFAMSIPMVFLATKGTLPLVGWLLFLATAIWALIYDTPYAMSDCPDDKKIGVKSLAIWLGDLAPHFVLFFQGIMLLLLIEVGRLGELNWPYEVSLVGAALLFFYQQRLLKTKNLHNYFRVFLNNHWVGAVIFVGIFLGSP